jgi:bacteriophage N4 adsorption protein B
VPLHQCIALCLAPLAIWILVSGLDDLFIDLVFVLTRHKRFPWPTDAELAHTTERRIAVFIPLWREDAVIGRMLERNLAAIRYSNYDVFVGVYPNDHATVRAVAQEARRHPRVHLCPCPHDGPTSKGDCLNWIYDGMREYERAHGVRFKIVMTHDAEDIVHADSLRLINWFGRDYAMVQVPVLPLRTGLAEFTHGLYCDEFAEYQTKDIHVRQVLGGFLPANGVGTGFQRKALDRLARVHGGRVFDPDCLTEDYENGYRLHALGFRQIFLPIRFEAKQPVATREYFPRCVRAAVRQRSRWVAGIVLQGWQHHGWRVPPRQIYWLWRDRKGMVGNLLAPLTNAIFAYGLITGFFRHPGALIPLWMARLCLVNYWMALIQLGVRGWCSTRIYGWRNAAGVLARSLWGNLVNFSATAAAIRQFAVARRERRGLAWRKTDHTYPRPRVGELLVQLRVLPMMEVEEAAMRLPKGVRLGEYLLQTRMVTADELHRALKLQAGMPEDEFAGAGERVAGT